MSARVQCGVRGSRAWQISETLLALFHCVRAIGLSNLKSLAPDMPSIDVGRIGNCPRGTRLNGAGRHGSLLPGPEEGASYADRARVRELAC